VINSLFNFILASEIYSRELDIWRAFDIAGSTKFWEFVGVQGLTLFLGFYGFTKISAIFFTDVCVHVMLLVDEADVCDDDEDFTDRRKCLFEELHAVFIDQSKLSGTLSETEAWLTFLLTCSCCRKRKSGEVQRDSE